MKIEWICFVVVCCIMVVLYYVRNDWLMCRNEGEMLVCKILKMKVLSVILVCFLFGNVRNFVLMMWSLGGEYVFFVNLR